MTKYLLVPDYFKGTMSSMDVTNIMDKTIRKHDKEAHIHSIPVADGEKVALMLFSMLWVGREWKLPSKAPIIILNPHFTD